MPSLKTLVSRQTFDPHSLTLSAFFREIEVSHMVRMLPGPYRYTVAVFDSLLRRVDPLFRGFMAQQREQFDPVFQFAECLAKGVPAFDCTALDGRWIGYPPMRLDRVVWPCVPDFIIGPLAYADHEIQARSGRPQELGPRLAAEPLTRKIVMSQKFQSERMYFPGRMSAGTECRELPAAKAIEKRFRHDAARGITYAEKEDVQGSLSHLHSFAPEAAHRRANPHLLTPPLYRETERNCRARDHA